MKKSIEHIDEVRALHEVLSQCSDVCGRVRGMLELCIAGDMSIAMLNSQDVYIDFRTRYHEMHDRVLDVHRLHETHAKEMIERSLMLLIEKISADLREKHEVSKDIESAMIRLKEWSGMTSLPGKYTLKYIHERLTELCCYTGLCSDSLIRRLVQELKIDAYYFEHEAYTLSLVLTHQNHLCVMILPEKNILEVLGIDDEDDASVYYLTVTKDTALIAQIIHEVGYIEYDDISGTFVHALLDTPDDEDEDMHY